MVLDADLLRNAMKSIGITLTPEQERGFIDYLGLLQASNQKVNLVSNSETEEILWKHFIDSLASYSIIGEVLKKHSTVSLLDIGAGAGFPGIPLKILFPEIYLTLLEATKKKADFLMEAIDTLMLSNVSVVWGRAEEYGSNKLYRELFDIVVARALAEMNTLAELTLPFVKPNGILLAYKGPNIKDELEKASKALETLGGTLEKQTFIEIHDFKRTFLIIRKTGQTPIKYPRRIGIPLKRPI
jgi:16S rRNA (guanine527-N7)-methyltransferase